MGVVEEVLSFAFLLFDDDEEEAGCCFLGVLARFFLVVVVVVVVFVGFEGLILEDGGGDGLSGALEGGSVTGSASAEKWENVGRGRRRATNRTNGEEWPRQRTSSTLILVFMVFMRSIELINVDGW